MGSYNCAIKTDLFSIGQLCMSIHRVDIYRIGFIGSLFIALGFVRLANRQRKPFC